VSASATRIVPLTSGEGVDPATGGPRLREVRNGAPIH
jgi:hypothetical protein